ncbi:hypothetical protein KA089_00810 [Candidatus Woesebacteria bacterium]|nr:hypothetical protein [Candidatus Woesebacteria bacterium]
MNKTKLAILLSTFGVLMIIASKPVSADGYGSYSVLPKPNQEVLKPVAAGIEDLMPQVAKTLIALSGLATTSFLIKKVK